SQAGGDEMKRGTNRLLAVSVFLVTLMAVECRAQQVSTFEQLQILVKPGDKIFVTDTSGVTVKARISDLSASNLWVVVNGKRRDLLQIDVRESRQWRGDSLKNGAWIGAIAGAGLVTFGLVAACESESCNPGFVAADLLLGAGLGAGIGVGI